MSGQNCWGTEAKAGTSLHRCLNLTDPFGLKADSVIAEGQDAEAAWNACKQSASCYAWFEHADTSSTVHIRIKDVNAATVKAECAGNAAFDAGCFSPGPGLSSTVYMNPAAASDPGLAGAVSAAGLVSDPTINYRFVWSHEVGGHARFHSKGMSCNESRANQIAVILTSLIP